ncbi:Uncharacterised protein [Mycobacterium tuberculosis]|uniref:Uncharacterized protein n=1 Tax=Mycobacterium tuberculosis TaxID=1773 RepID=A0A0T9DLD8_MYCTX|nr:Uncharacterised protein [Mycobacterium tuberculosis]CFS10367.1 Uncharacterised protein [Mycobacterium tuberculosis]CKR40173.1 Uncharacterised protein [Mycobacterium tuberculosis]CKS10210.1 Uncharacterised protein [Mycobacterium tuberculosis]CKS16236.1 Uncharacterised protein [Mycobacterium tuberculosis]
MRDPGAESHTAIGVFGRLIGHQVDVFRFGAVAGDPAHPVGHGRPALLCRSGSHDETEMPCPDETFVDLGVGRGPPDAAYRRRLADVVDLTDERQYRASDIGKRHHLAADGETTRHHSVVRDELLEQFRDRRARPGDPSFGFQEPALLFPRQQCLAVVQLTHEVHPGLRGFEWVHHLKTHARHPAWDIQAIEDVIGHEIGDRSAHVRRDAHGQRGQGVHRRAERDHAGDVLRTPVCRGLIAEHATLRIPDEVHIVASGVLDGIDRLAEGDDVVGQVTAHSALDLVG